MHTYVSFVRRGRSAHRRRTNHGGDASWPFLESFLASPLPGTRVDINEPEQIIFSPLAIGDHGVVGKANLYNPYPPLPPSPPPPFARPSASWLCTYSQAIVRPHWRFLVAHFWARVAPAQRCFTRARQTTHQTRFQNKRDGGVFRV